VRKWNIANLLLCLWRNYFSLWCATNCSLMFVTAWKYLELVSLSSVIHGAFYRNWTSPFTQTSFLCSQIYLILSPWELRAYQCFYPTLQNNVYCLLYGSSKTFQPVIYISFHLPFIRFSKPLLKYNLRTNYFKWLRMPICYFD